MTAAQGEKFCLRWNDFEKNISSSFRELNEDKDFFDVTIACGDNQIQGHKVILSACSPFFRSILKKNPHQHPLLYLKGVKYEEILLVLNFMYHGEVNVAQDELNSFLSVAEDLQVKGLTQNQNQTKSSRVPDESNNAKRYRVEDNSSPRPLKQPRPKPNYIQPPSNSEKFQSRNEIQEIRPYIKTEAPALIDDSNCQQLVESNDYQAEQGYEYDQSYQEDTIMYQEGEMQMNMEQMQNSSQDVHSCWITKEFICDVCLKQFSSKKSLQNHMWIHKGKTTCAVCSKIFSTTSNLNLHMRNSHGSASETN